MERVLAGFPWPALLVLICFTLTQAYYFEDGYDHHYTYSSETDLLGKKNITTVLKFEIRALNTTEDGKRLHSLHVNSLVQFADGGFYQNNPKGWELTKTFLFLTSLNGSIVLVHVHPEDEDELVIIKKAITSIFSVTVREETAAYEEEEEDHMGPLRHNYEVKRTQTGRTISRSHFSHERAERTHEKILHYDQSGTLHSGEAFDRIRIKEKHVRRNKPNPVIPGEKLHKVATSGDVPVIWTSTRTHVHLDGKRLQDRHDSSSLHSGLKEDKLLIKLRVIRKRIHEVSQNISTYLHCVHDHPEKGDANRTDCVHSLREILMSLHKDDYKEFGQSVLNKTCTNTSDRCSVERLVFIDIIARIADDISQKLIVDYVLNKNDPNEEELRHVFIHCIGVEKPLLYIVEAVEKYCFGGGDKHHGSINVTETQKRACLAVGSLTRNLHLNSNNTEALRLVDKIETWIDKHETHPQYRQKRSLHFEKDHQYITSKLVLIHSLGNAGHPKSLDRIIALASPYQGHHNWRRAAVGGLRHYTCNKSASALLDSALRDDKQSVRKAAKHHYLRHPRGTSFTREQENIILSHEYSWPVVARLKRSFLDVILFQFHLDLPTVDWKKVIGNSAIGASFGVYFENGISGAFRPLAGFVDVSLYDKLWAEAHIGLLNLHLDILLIEVCYKGRLEYNMNKFKDFTVGLVENLVGAYDDMAQEIIKPMTDAANKMSSHFLAPDGKTTKSNFEPLANAVKEIPLKTEAALNASIELNELVQRYQSLPWVTRLQQVVDQAQSLMEGVNNDALNFYKKVSDSAIVALPFAEKEIMDSINRASTLMDKISKFPKQAFSQLEKSRLKFQMGLSRVFASNTVIKEATSLLKGQSSSWLSKGQDIGNIVSTMKGILSSVSTARRRKRRSTTPFDQVNDVLDNEGESTTEIFLKIEARVKIVTGHMETIRDKEPLALQDGLDKQKQATFMLQHSFTVLQQTVEKMKSTIQSLFGSKFHPAFPGQRRPPDGRCGKGIYPAGTRQIYNTNGIDLVLKEGWKVVCPVSGLVSKTGNNKVIIKPTDADFKQYEIVIANINPSVDDEEKHYDQGDVIGTSAGKNGCEWPHIHLAVKKKTEAAGEDLCFYMDPSPFVDKLKLKPVWQQECKDFTFKHIGQVIDFKHPLAALMKLAEKALIRAAVNWVKDLAIKELEKLITPDSIFGKIPGFMTGILDKVGVLSDVTGLFKGVGNTMKKFFSAINVKNMGFGALTGLLKSSVGTSRMIPKLTGLLGKASTLMKKLPLGNLKTFATGGLGKKLASFGIKAIGGKLASKVQLKTSMFKECPHFKNGFPFGLDRMCSVAKDCLGFTCHFNIPLKRIKGGVTLKVKIHLEEAKIEVNLNGEGQLAPKGNSVAKTGVKLGPFSFSLKSSAQWEGGAVKLSLSLSPCYSGHCLHDIKVVKNLHLHLRHKRSVTVEILSPELKEMNIAGITDQLANLNIPGGEFVGQLNGMMDGIRSQMCEHQEDPIGAFDKELDAEQEYEDHQDYPNGKPLYIPFFPDMEFNWPAGPVLFVIGCSAGAELGQDITADVQAVKSTVTTRIAPFVVGKVRASMAISIVIASAGISLTGWLMRTAFPFVLEVNYAKLPAIQTKKLLIELTPIELRLRGFVKIFFIINIHFDIWHWRSPTLTGTIWKHTKEIDSKRPPRFPNCGNGQTPTDIGGPSCSVHQIKGRHPLDTAFLLEVDSQDDSSPVTLHYSIGRSRGGRDVRSLVEMQGPSLTEPTTSLPNGVPLYFTVRARNTQGQESIATCMLPTFDNTVPDGRVDAAYQFTSHRTTIQAHIVVFEDSNLLPPHEVAVGYSPGEFGKEVVEWEDLILTNSKLRQNVESSLKNFSPSRKGSLSSHPMQSTQETTDVDCANKCIQNGTKCVSFDYDLHFQTCNLQQTVMGPNAKLVISGSYFYYERLGVGYSTFVEYSDLQLEHGAQYYVNAKIINVLNYTAYLPSSGTLADFTPPEPGPVGEAASDILVADGCRAAVTQRCIDGNSELNHRKILDGPGSRTVFNGNKPLEDRKSTYSNNFISGNCDGFHDDESGIWGYTWAAGTTICGSDVVSFRDPHASLQSREDWTFTGLGKNLHLPDGPYYITFQAINNVVHGGALVTTVCHSQPYTVDTTPPLVHEVGDLLFDEDFDILGVYFNVSDDGSGIARVDFGLGRTKYDVFVRSYSRHHFMTRNDPYLVIEDLGLKPGVQAWVRIRAVNNVDQFTASHGDVPILIDFTPPVKGRVLDGAKLHQDIDYQHDTTKICAQWIEFYDPESGIDSYIWGVGTTMGHDDIVPFQNFTHRVKSKCHETVLHHNTSYYSTIIALNGALNQKEIKEISNGVLVDTTHPSQGFVRDGSDLDQEVDFSSQTATIQSCWANFTDPESHVPEYAVSVYINDELKKVLEVGPDTIVTDHTLAMKHLDKVRVDVTATNGAGLETLASSDGYLVDETPPIMVYLRDSETGRYQQNETKLVLQWYFTDAESGIADYRYTIQEKIGGQKRKFWPKDKPYEVTTSQRADVTLDTLQLRTGAVYSLTVSAFNRALLVTKVQSNGVMIDTTEPSLENVIIGLPNEEEELDDDGNVVHTEGEPLHVSWTAQDLESGIVHSLLCIEDGTVQCNETNQFTDYGTDSSVTTAASNLMHGMNYLVVIRVTNGAGLSCESKSKPIVVLKGNSPGTVYDGRDSGQDANYQQDMSSISMSFAGFESESCGITGYDWGIGTEPYITDIMRFTNYGLTMLDDNTGVAETSNTNFENVKYYVTVRAITGEDCHESYIVSSSDGITVDRKVPVIVQQYEETQLSKDVIFQNQTETLPLSWSVEDESGLHSLSWSIDKYPGLGEKHAADISKTHLEPTDSSLEEGKTYFVTTFAMDMAGNEAHLISPPITIDKSVSFVKDFNCTPFVSKKMKIITCSWQVMEENESKLSYINASVHSSPDLPAIAVSQLSVTDHKWSFDLDEAVTKSSLSFLYVKLDLTNEAYLQKQFVKQVTVDNTPPRKGIVEVMTTNNISSSVGTFCQIPTTYVSLFLGGFADDESGIHRYEVGLGSSRGSTDIYPFTEVRVVNGLATLQDLNLPPRLLVYINVRIFNNAGMSTVQESGTVAVSPEPYLTVSDGPGSEDVDSQHDLSVIQGRWAMSDPCPVVSAEWAIEDITGELVQDYEHTPGDGTLFYSDELELKNMRTYVVLVKVVDLLNRTIMARSDGVMVQIQPPVPGHVRDGLDEDINYQLPTDYLAANWDPFGEDDTDKISQQITHYEVAVGDDRRYEETRSNVHFYENIGLNTSYVFQQLNLTAKIKTYYITVRAFSEAGSFEQSFSNGIRVGYGNEILPGDISVNTFQSSSRDIDVVWTDFTSDFEIKKYEVAVHTNDYETPNGSMECSSIDFSPIVPFTSVGKNTIANIENIKLNHSEVYFVIVKAEDEAGICLMATSEGITVDTTPPSAGDVSIEGGRSGGMMYARDMNTLHVKMTGFVDEESSVDHYTVQLLGGAICSGHKSADVEHKETLISVEVSDTEAHFNDIILETTRVYYLEVTGVNKAGLSTSVTSSPIVTDISPPNPGDVKVGPDWKRNSRSWSNTHQLVGTLAINLHQGDVTCELQKDLLHSKEQELEVYKGPFDIETVKYLSNSDVQIYARLDPSLRFFQKGGLRTGIHKLTEGNYSFALQTASEYKVSSIIALTQDSLPEPEVILKVLNKEFIDNCSNTKCDDSSRLSLDGNWNFGLLFTMEDPTSDPLTVLWAKDRSKLKATLVRTAFDPRVTVTEYTFQAHNRSSRYRDSWDIDLLINGQLHGKQAGLDISGDMIASVFTWNNDGYIPPVNDPFDPFSVRLILSALKVPRGNISACHYGKLFSDSGSGLRDIYIGLSDSQNETANVMPYIKHKSFCVPCTPSCVQNCSFESSCMLAEEDVAPIQHFTIENLTLTPSSLTDVANYTDTETSAYYLDVKVTDHAGYTTEVKSEAVIIDITPPVVSDVTCYDPDNSLFEPAPFLGNDHSVAASWEISEDFSDVTAVYVGIGSHCGDKDILEPLFIDKDKKTTLNLTDSRFKDDHLYHVSVTVYNSAGLKGTSCCNFTTDYRVPAPPPSGPQALFTTSETVPGLDVGFTEYSDRVGIEWGDPLGDVEYFEWELVSEDSHTSIYPPMRVGTKSARRVEIVKGNIAVKNGTVKLSVSEYLNRNFSDGLKSSDFSNGPLSLEPGKCFFQVVSHLSRAHKKTKLHPQKTCIKGKGSFVLTPENQTTLILEKGQVHKTNRQTNQNDSTISCKVSRGALTVGLLSAGDLQMTYGAPAAINYSPYIVNPDLTSTQLSRYLMGRLVHFGKTQFYLSPVTDVHLGEDITVTIPENELADTDDKQETSLIFWDAEQQIWRHTDEVCPTLDPDKEKKVPNMFKICNILFDAADDEAEDDAGEAADDPNANHVHRRARSLSPEDTEDAADDPNANKVYRRPRFLTTARIRKSITNTPPVIDTKSIPCKEDNYTRYTVKYHDRQGDRVLFVIETPPLHGTANITSGGLLFYRPDKDFSGIDSVVLKIKEKLNTFLAVQPHEVRKQIYLNVSNVNDQPVSFYQHGSDSPVPSDVEPIHRLYLEGNQTDHVLGSFWIADVDHSETLRLLQKNTSGTHANFSLSEKMKKDGDETYDNMTKLYSRATISNYHLHLKTSLEYHGNVNFSILVVDSMNSYSHSLMVEVFVLISPCYHGRCVPTTTGLPCSHPTRAETFNPYSCQCEAGYEGGFCKDEINECHQATCSLLYDCEDRLAAYECVLNTPKMVAIFMCILLPVSGVCFFIWRRCKKMKSHAKIWDLPDNSDGMKAFPVFRPPTAMGTFRPPSADDSGVDLMETGKDGHDDRDDVANVTADNDVDDVVDDKHDMEAEDEDADEVEVSGTSDVKVSVLMPPSSTLMPSPGSADVRPGYAPMPHRKDRFVTSTLHATSKDLPRVEQ